MAEPTTNKQDVQVLTAAGLHEVLEAARNDAGALSYSSGLDMELLRSSEDISTMRAAMQEAGVKVEGLFPFRIKIGEQEHLVLMTQEDNAELSRGKFEAEPDAVKSVTASISESAVPAEVSVTSGDKPEVITPQVVESPQFKSETVDQLDPKAMYLAVQDAKIEQAREAGNEDHARYLEILKANEDKAIYQDAASGATITILDGDSESIKPHLELTHDRALERAGGFDQLIEQKTSVYQQAVDEGRMNQAVMDKELEILREAGTDSEKFAQLRFENNGFFAEQAESLGLDPAKVNDITIATTQVVTMIRNDGEPEEEPANETGGKFDMANLDERTLIKTVEGNTLTTSGAMLTVLGGMSSTLGADLDIVGQFKENFELLMEKHGTLDNVVTHLEQDMTDLFGSETDMSGMSQDHREQILEAVKNSEGNSARFAASVFNDANDRMPIPTPTGVTRPAGEDPAIEATDRNSRAIDMQTIMGGMSLGDGDDLLNFFGMLIAFFTGQDPAEVVAGLKQQNTENTDETPTIVADRETPNTENTDETPTIVADRETPNTENTDETPAVVADRETPNTENTDETPTVVADRETSVTQPNDSHDKVEALAMEVTAQTLIDNPQWQASEAKVEEIKADLDQKLAAGEIDAEEHYQLFYDQTKDMFKQDAIFVEQVKANARIYAANELGVPLAEVYPKLAENNPDRVAVRTETGTPESTNDETVAVADADAEISKPDDETVTVSDAYASTSDDAIVTVSNNTDVRELTDGAATYEVTATENGKPVMNFEESAVVFENGNNVQNAFGEVSNPDVTQVAMVNPFLEAVNALDAIGYEKDEAAISNSGMAFA